MRGSLRVRCTVVLFDLDPLINIKTLLLVSVTGIIINDRPLTKSNKQKAGKKMTQTIFKKPLKFKKSHFSALDVAWFAPKRKSPIAYSTTADSDAITLAAHECGSLINVIKYYDHNQILLSKESIEIIQILLSYGITNLK